MAFIVRYGIRTTATKRFSRGAKFEIGNNWELRIRIDGKQVHIFAAGYWHYINDEGQNV